jgi:outer membrane protein TolC
MDAPQLLARFFVAGLAIKGASIRAQNQETRVDLVARALAVNPEIEAARQHLKEAQSHVSEMAGHRKLQLSLDGSASFSTGQVAQPSSTQSFGTVQAGLTSPIPNFRRATAEIDQAGASLIAARAQLLRAELDVEFRTSDAFFELLRAREAQSIAEESLKQAQRQADDTKRRIDAGDVPPADLLKAQVPVAQGMAALARAKNAARLALQTLNDLLQRDLDAPIDARETSDAATSAPSAREATDNALRLSPDVVEADATEKAAEANERVVRRQRDPDYSLQLTHTESGDPTAYAYLSTLALSVSLPVADGGVAKEQIKQAQLQTDQARTALRLAQQRVRLGIEQALLDVEGDEANLAANIETEEIARQSLEKAHQAYDAGLTTTRDVLDAQLVYRQARIDTNSARYDLEIARAHVKQLMGGALP